jgi:hypothetical protein
MQCALKKDGCEKNFIDRDKSAATTKRSDLVRRLQGAFDWSSLEKI